METKVFMRRTRNGIKDLAKLAKGGIVVEIGSCAGESTEEFAKVAKKVYAIDPWLDDYSPEVNLKFKMSEAKAAFDERLKPYSNVEVLQMTSNEASKLIKDKSVDLVYIDGDHRYEFVKEDIELWIPKLKDGGIMSGHDLNLSGVIHAIADTLNHTVDKIYADGSWSITIGENLSTDHNTA